MPETDFTSAAGFQQQQPGLACLTAVKALDARRKAIESVKAFLFLLIFESEETITINSVIRSFRVRLPFSHSLDSVCPICLCVAVPDR